MDLHEVQNATARFFTDANAHFQRIPGSAIAVRYIKSSYQNDPVRSAIELFLFLFAVRYLLAPKYSTKKKVQLTDAVCYALVVGRACADVGIGDRRIGRGLDARTACCTADST
jgi:serine palmitoyltransferase